MRWDDLSREDLLKLVDVDALVLLTVRSPDGFTHPVCDIHQHRLMIEQGYSDIVVIDPGVRQCPDLRSRVFSLWVTRRVYDRTSRGEELKRLLLDWDGPVTRWERADGSL